MALSPPPGGTPQSLAGWFQELWSILSRIRVGVGVPTAEAPNGTVYLRTDGSGAALYVREGGAWIAK